MEASQSIGEKLLEVRRHDDSGYCPLVDFKSWRVAVLNFSEDLRPENIDRMQRHNETDEVFVLLEGSAILFVGEGEGQVSAVHAQSLELHTLYNVKRAVWHHHTLTEDAKVLVVENRDTTYDNSPFCDLSAAQQQQICEMTEKIWGGEVNDV